MIGFQSSQIFNPWFYVILFVVSSFLMIWRLEAMGDHGVEGTVLGTLVMPYCSGLGNLILAVLIGSSGGPGDQVVTNCLVNNVTNLTIVVGIPAMIWGMPIICVGKGSKAKGRNGHKLGNHQRSRINRLSLLLTLTAVLFFSGAFWSLASAGRLGQEGGIVLVGLFLFWQCFQFFDVLKNNVRHNKRFSLMLVVDLSLLAMGAYGTYLSIDWLVNWLAGIKTGFISAKNLGLLSGWMMVVPNALLAVYYGWTRRPEIIYTSQVGDSHICIPLCVGIFALYQPITMPVFFKSGMIILSSAALLHIFCVSIFGKLPRVVGLILTVSYGFFVYKGFLN